MEWISNSQNGEGFQHRVEILVHERRTRPPAWQLHRTSIEHISNSFRRSIVQRDKYSSATLSIKDPETYTGRFQRKRLKQDLTGRCRPVVHRGSLPARPSQAPHSVEPSTTAKNTSDTPRLPILEARHIVNTADGETFHRQSTTFFAQLRLVTPIQPRKYDYHPSEIASLPHQLSGSV